MYKVTFIDDTEFTGGDPKESLWDMLPNKQIKSILYWLSEDRKFSFTNFEEYNHCVERAYGMTVKLDIVTKAIIMGRVKNRVYKIVFDFQTGTVAQDVKPYGKEYNDNALIGWKQGVMGEQPKLRTL
jgi:hypothetical protein